ncbi:MAG TPA: Gfo/Idh/MocA family oxidoreductase, partial [Gemmataceae bacterium]|nr:Gfo/Idh/MocA family oxidoreductase [Gemmataceae bacterium]
MSDNSRITSRRFLVLGCGSIGKRHLGNLLSAGAGEVFGFDVRADRAEEVRRQYGVTAFTDLEQAFSTRPDVVLVTAPTSFHVPLALQAAERGCHLFIEKPLSHSRDGVDQLLEVIRRKNLITLVGCNMRFHPGLMLVKRLVDEGAVGRIVAVRAEVGQYLPDWHTYEDYRQGYSARKVLGGGTILDAIHEISYTRWLMGPVHSVACFAGKLSHLEIETEDTAAVLVRYASGSLGEIHMDYVQRTYSRSCRVIGDGGTIHWDYVAGEVKVFRAGRKSW